VYSVAVAVAWATGLIGMKTTVVHISTMLILKPINAVSAYHIVSLHVWCAQ
jgi:hypothetical protein